MVHLPTAATAVVVHLLPTEALAVDDIVRLRDLGEHHFHAGMEAEVDAGEETEIWIHTVRGRIRGPGVPGPDQGHTVQDRGVGRRRDGAVVVAAVVGTEEGKLRLDEGEAGGEEVPATRAIAATVTGAEVGPEGGTEGGERALKRSDIDSVGAASLTPYHESTWNADLAKKTHRTVGSNTHPNVLYSD